MFSSINYGLKTDATTSLNNVPVAPKEIVELNAMSSEEAKKLKEQLYHIFIEALDEGTSYAMELPCSYTDFEEYFCNKSAKVFVCKEEATVLGGFYLKPNFLGKGAHIANAGYVVSAKARGQKIGHTMAVYSLQKAKELGYQAMQYNCVLSENSAAVALWKKVGFNIIGTIPEAIKMRDGHFQAAYIMYKKLD